ncbi:MAG: ribonuclease E inhibitor RraB [Candidatus Dormibacteraeota bacterium]|nr:ribonuclease E inhibitor RraB [Candidatus Dormibacteraeota bacterium]
MDPPPRPGVDWLGWFLPRSLVRRPPRTTSLAPPHPDDLIRLDELRRLGSRLDLQHPVRSFVTFDDEVATRAARDRLEEDGYRCQVRHEAGAWTLTAIAPLVPTPQTLTRLREHLLEVCGPLAGSVRGWEAPVVH